MHFDICTLPRLHINNAWKINFWKERDTQDAVWVETPTFVLFIFCLSGASLFLVKSKLKAGEDPEPGLCSSPQ